VLKRYEGVNEYHLLEDWCVYLINFPVLFISVVLACKCTKLNCKRVKRVMIINLYVRGVVYPTSYERQKGNGLLSLGNRLVRSGHNIAVGCVYLYLK
jgi:hypothetical protein